MKKFSDFLLEKGEPVATAILGTPAGGKSYVKGILGDKFDRLTNIDNPKSTSDLTKDQIRANVQKLSGLKQLMKFFRSYNLLKSLNKKDPKNFDWWFNNIKETWNGIKEKEPNLNIEIKNDVLTINGKTEKEDVEKEFQKIDCDSLVAKFDKYKDYISICRTEQYDIQSNSINKKKDIAYDEPGADAEEMIATMKKLDNKDYITNVIMIHHQTVAVNLIQNAFRMVVGDDGGRDSSSSIINSYNKIDSKINIYKKNSEVSLEVDTDELKSGKGNKTINKANVQDDESRGNRPIDVFLRVKGKNAVDTFNMFLGNRKLDSDDKKIVFKSLIRYQAQTKLLNLDKEIRDILLNCVKDINNTKALDILKKANEGKLKDKFKFPNGGISDKLVQDAEKVLTEETETKPEQTEQTKPEQKTNQQPESETKPDQSKPQTKPEQTKTQTNQPTKESKLVNFMEFKNKIKNNK